MESKVIEIWQDVVSSAFVPLRCTSLSQGFSARLETIPLSDGVTLAHVTSGPVQVERTAALAHQDTDDDLLMSLQLKSTGEVHQHGRTARLTPGTAALYETNRPYVLDQHQRGQELIVLRVPRAQLGLKDPLVTDLCGRTIDSSVPALAALAGYLAGVAGGQAQLVSHVRHELGQISMNLLRLALGSFAGIRGTGWEHDQSILESSKAYIQAHLDDPTLSVESLARTQHVSIRKLHSVFSSTDTTPAAYARQLRMERATSLLAARPFTQQSIRAIAAACGFRDTSTFTRAFSKAYECSPTQWSARAVQGGESDPEDGALQQPL